MKIKVCGMKYPDNIKAVQQCGPDFMGFIFYEKSPRYVTNEQLYSETFFNKKIKTVGVFVKSPILEVLNTIKKHNLDFVQLHGMESIGYVKKLHAENVKIIKAFQIDENFDWTSLSQYANYVSFFLFDTASKKYGGSGLKFDWNQLKMYQEDIPFFLSGGIHVDDLKAIKKLRIKQLFGIDINSKFEVTPGIKNVVLIKEMINQLKNGSNISSK